MTSNQAIAGGCGAAGSDPTSPVWMPTRVGYSEEHPQPAHAEAVEIIFDPRFALPHPAGVLNPM